MTDVSEQSVAEVLNRAADLLEPEGAWTQGEYARGASGRRVVTLRAAKCFCVIGAIDAVQGYAPGTEASMSIVDFLRRAVLAETPYDVADWNDTKGRTQSEVVAALRSAALLAAPRAGEGE